MANLIYEHPVRKSIAILFHPFDPTFLSQNTYSIFWDLFIRVFCGAWQFNVEIRK